MTGKGSWVRIPHRSSIKQGSNPFISRVWAFSLISVNTIFSLYFYTLHKYCTETAPRQLICLTVAKVPLFAFLFLFVHYVQNRSSNRSAVFFCISSFVCEYISSVIPTLACPNRSLTTFGFSPIRIKMVACVCLKL